MGSPVLIYDNQCATCSAGIAVAKKCGAEKRIRFVGMHTREGVDLVAHNDLDMNRSAYLIEERDAPLEKSTMVMYVLSHMGIVGIVVRNLYALLPKRVADRLYDFAARHRSHATKSGVASAIDE